LRRIGVLIRRYAGGFERPAGQFGQSLGDLGYVVGLADDRGVEAFWGAAVLAVAGGEQERHAARRSASGHRHRPMRR